MSNQEEQNDEETMLKPVIDFLWQSATESNERLLDIFIGDKRLMDEIGNLEEENNESIKGRGASTSRETSTKEGKPNIKRRKLDNKEELRKTIREMLECPVCRNWPTRGEIKACKNGHTVCAECRVHTRVCPICRNVSVDSRQLTAEKMLVEELKTLPAVACKFQKLGCKAKYKFEFLEYHEDLCIYNTIPCVQSKCFWYGYIKDYFNHVQGKNCFWSARNYRKDDVTTYIVKLPLIEDFMARFSRLPPIWLFSDQYWHLLITIEMVKMEYSKWVLFARSTTGNKIRNNLQIRIKIFNPQQYESFATKPFSLEFTGKIHGITETVSQVYTSGECIEIRDAHIAKLLPDNPTNEDQQDQPSSSQTQIRYMFGLEAEVTLQRPDLIIKEQNNKENKLESNRFNLIWKLNPEFVPITPIKKTVVATDITPMTENVAVIKKTTTNEDREYLEMITPRSPSNSPPLSPGQEEIEIMQEEIEIPPDEELPND